MADNQARAYMRQRVCPERIDQMKNKLLAGDNCDLCGTPAVMACYEGECGELYCQDHKEKHDEMKRGHETQQKVTGQAVDQGSRFSAAISSFGIGIGIGFAAGVVVMKMK